METLDFWIQNGASVDPFICTPYVGSPIYYDNKDFILEQYDERLKLINNGTHSIDEKTLKEWKLAAVDTFMKDCGDAFQYTATISQNFTIPELFALKNFMYTQDASRMLQMAHQRYELLGAEQWNHSKKWDKYCPVCKAKIELEQRIQMSIN
jgi:hypothetical protein